MNPSHVIEELQSRLAWAPAWTISVAVIAVALVVTLVGYEFAVRAVRRTLRRRDAFWRSLVVRTRGPVRLGLILGAISWSVAAAPFPPAQAGVVQHIVGILVIVLLGWAALTATDIGSALYMRRYRIDAEDNLLARKHLTQVRILRRAVAVLIILATAGVALMTIPTVRQVGVSLLAAGGAAGIIVGFALQPLLSNLVAGVQIALTQPIRIDDAVVIEGEWGRVEEITGTYVVIRIWDLRRLIVPLKYFMEKPFQNWTRQTSNLIGSVMLYVDYSTPVDAVRAKLKAILEASPLWDRKVMALQVTDARERTMELRCLAGAGNSGDAFDLRCEVREKLIAFLQADYPHALPRDRLDLQAELLGEASGAGSRPRAERVQ